MTRVSIRKRIHLAYESALYLNKMDITAFFAGNRIDFLEEKPVGNVAYYRVVIQTTLREHTDGYCSDVDNDSGGVSIRKDKYTRYLLAPTMFLSMQWSAPGECTVEWGSGCCKHTNEYKILSITGVNL